MLLYFVIVASLRTVRLATRVGIALSRATNVVVVPGEEASEGRTKKPTAPLVTREVVEAEAAEDASATIAGKSAIRYFLSFSRHDYHPTIFCTPQPPSFADLFPCADVVHPTRCPHSCVSTLSLIKSFQGTIRPLPAV
jgi:hypothetical protein